jgi:hypothetical protein
MKILSKKRFFGAKICKTTHTKTALTAKVANIFEMDFCFVSSNDQFKMCKFTF